MEERRREVMEVTQELVGSLRFKPALKAFEMLHIVGYDDLRPDKYPNSGNVAVFGLVRHCFR